MSQPTGSQQAAINPAPHAATVAGVPHGPPAQKDADDTDMLDDDEPEDITEQSDCVYIPGWSHPDWDEKIDFYVKDWRYFKAKRRGDAAVLRRPALRPEDDISNPVSYTPPSSPKSPLSGAYLAIEQTRSPKIATKQS